MERRAGMTLVNRTTRRMMLTLEGDVYLDYARRILNQMDEFGELLGNAKQYPKGLLRVNVTLGFRCNQVDPAISRSVARHPEALVQLRLSAMPPPLTGDALNVCIRFGEPSDTRVVARWLASNRRLLCAAPAYLAQHGTPTMPYDLTRHNCIDIR